jgi:class 3 adenylate cyclase
VLDTLTESACRLCDASDAVLLLREGDFLRFAAHHGSILMDSTERKLSRAWVAGRSVLDRKPIHVHDLLSEKAEFPVGHADALRQGHRTIVAVPLMREQDVIGAINMRRTEVRPFTDKQIALIETFADQAVIAIKNARLLNELRQRTDDLSESLEQQTATSEVLQVINSSPGDLTPVFDAILEKAHTLCGVTRGSLQLYDGAKFRAVAVHGHSEAYADRLRQGGFSVGPNSVAQRLLEGARFVQIPDQGANDDPLSRAAFELDGIRTALVIPLRKDGIFLGRISANRQEVKLFTEKEIGLLESFAAQAVIAIENARLLNELRQRTDDLSEALEQQTATSEVLKVISSSPGELKPVFEAILTYAVRICGAKFGTLFLCEGDDFRVVAQHNTPPALAEFRQREPILRLGPGTSLYRSKEAKQPIQIPDLTAEPLDFERDQKQRVALVELGGYRGILSVPMVKESEVIGAINMYRQDAGTFSDNQVELVKNFAAQAVIAIENTRLLDDLNKLNQQLERRVADQVSEIERMSRLRRFLPPQVADLIVASGAEKQLESHRREITALFCDLRGFTGFSEASAPEDVMALLRDYHAAIGEIIIKYSGTLERYAGDGVMVVFNDPVPVDNPALRAVLMALETREAMGALMEKWRQLGHDVGFGIGIAHGFATLGTIGFEGRFDYAAIGTVSNVASRLCDEAKPGQILISPRVFTAVKDAVTVEPMGEFTLKGIGRPLAAYNVLGAKPAD